MSCCTNGDCCGPGSYCCANTGPHKHPEMVSDLRVVIHPKQRDHQALRDHTRPATVEDVSAWLREQGAIDYEAATNITRELTSHLPADFEGSYDATVWTLNIVDAALRVEGEEE